MENTYGTFLMYKKSDKWEKVADIKDYPDIGGSSELLETTTLSDDSQTYIPGIKKNDALSFTHNYSLELYKTLKQLKGQELDLAIWFGGEKTGNVTTPTGTNGKYSFKGIFDEPKITGKGTNEVREIVSSIAPTSGFSLDEE